MRFKKLLFSILFLGGCSLHLNEPPYESPTIKIESNTKCVDETAGTLEKYMDGQADSKKINDFLDCTKKTIEAFLQFTKGSQDGLYYIKEIKNFAEKYVFKRKMTPDSLLNQTLALKRSLFGGAQETVTAGEFQKVLNLIESLRAPLIALHPYMPLSSSRVLKFDEETFEKSILALNQLGKVLTESFLQETYSFTFYQLSELLKGLEKFSETDKEVFRFYEKQLASLYWVKPYLMGGVKDEISANEWGQLFQRITQSYALWLRGSYFLNQYSTKWSSGVENVFLIRTLEAALNLLENSVQNHSGQVISYPEIEGLIDRFSFEKSILPKETLKKIFTPFIKSVLSAEKVMKIKNVEKELPSLVYGIGLFSIQRLKNALKEWSLSQRSLERAALNLAQSTGQNWFTPEQWGQELGHSEVGRELAQLIQIWPMYDDSKRPDEMTFDNHSLKMYSLEPLSKMNWLYRVTKLMLRGYSEHMPGGELGATEGDIKQFIKDFGQVFADFKFLHPLKLQSNLYALRFLEANMFTFASHTDSWTTAQEVTELIAYMISAKKLASGIHKEVGELCKAKGLTEPELDYFGGLKIKSRCYWKTIFDGIVKDDGLPAQKKPYWSHFPGLVTTILNGASKKKDLVKLLTDFMIINRTPVDPSTEYVTSADSETAAAILQFVETILSRYDADHSGSLNRAEAMKAYPDFSDVIKKLAGKSGVTDPQALETLYTYLLYEAKFPESTIEKYDYWLWKNKYWDWSLLPPSLSPPELNTDRIMLFKIFIAVMKNMGT